VTKPRFWIGGLSSSGRVMQWLSRRPPGRSLDASRAAVRVELAGADVLGEPDRADRVEVALPHVAVVAVAQVDLPDRPEASDELLPPDACCATA
jgi:hypothetical protein